MAECTPEIWTLKSIKEALEKESSGKRKIVIPMFQRGKRWNKEKKETFIDSLRKRYPIGTLLFYKTVDKKGDDNVQEVYTLIDGLQRATAIREYLSTPSKFFKITDFSDATLTNIYDLTIVGGNANEQKQIINKIIVDYIHTLKNFDDLEISEMFIALSDAFPTLLTKLQEFINILKEDVKRIKDNYSSLRDMTIPAIVYSGSEETLPEIFERINSKGVALTEYEIYAASWPRKEFNIKNENIIIHVLKKYDLLNDTEYAVKDYDREAKRLNKNVNSFEYVFGLSKYIQNKYSSLRFYTKFKADETNPVAFQLLNACFNSAHSQIKEVYQIILRFSENIERLEEALFSSIEFVNKCIEPILKFKGNNRNKEGKMFHSQYQIMSLISFAFRKKYDINDDKLKVLDSWKSTKNILKNNIWKYYVYDIIIKYWGDGGTGKIHTANSTDRYLTELTKNQFGAAYDSHIETMYNRRESSKVSNPKEIEYVMLNTIYLNTFTAMDQLDVNKFDVEHIATKGKMKEKINSSSGDGLPLSHFANLCYLPEYTNRSKGSKHFYEDEAYLNKSKVSLGEIEEKYSFTSKEDLEFLGIDYGKEDFSVLKEFYIEFLKNRSEILKKKFLESLGFVVDENKEEQNQDIQKNEIIFDDKFFRLTKIGELVRLSMAYLSNNKLITNEEITLLQDKDFSNKLGCYLPILTVNEEDTIDNKNYKRYYSEKIVIFDKEYYLCKEWKENSRSKFAPWVKAKLQNINK